MIPSLLGAYTLALSGCSGLSDTHQRALSGTAIGAGGGAILGAIGGNAALGAVAGAGLIGGLIYDNVKKNEQASYQQGYYAAVMPHLAAIEHALQGCPYQVLAKARGVCSIRDGVRRVSGVVG
jgi:hypothetical protein